MGIAADEEFWLAVFRPNHFPDRRQHEQSGSVVVRVRVDGVCLQDGGDRNASEYSAVGLRSTHRCVSRSNAEKACDDLGGSHPYRADPTHPLTAVSYTHL